MIKLKPSKSAWEHRGFILLPVVFALALLAAIAYLLNRQSAINTGNVNREHQLDAALYTAQAGYNHALWQLNTKNCSGYTAIPTTSLGQNSYSASFTDAAGTTSTSGSPININVTASKPDGSSYTINRYREKVYQYPTSTLVLQPNAAIGKDTMLYQLKPTLNYGAVDKLSVSAFGANPWQALLSFDLTKLSKNHKIVSAKLELYQTYVGAGAGDVGVHKMLAAWAEGSQSPGSVGPGANWNEADTGMAWSKPGGDYAALPVATFKPNIGIGWNQWDITSLVADWVSGGSTNNGLMLRPEDTNSDAYYASSDHTDALLRPKLTINYACECGQTCAPPVTLPIAYWQLDETSGLTAVDSVGGHNGTLINGPIWSVGKLNGGLQFDGVDDYINVPHNNDLSLTSSFTLSAWINSYALQADTAHTLIAKEIDINNSNYWFGTWGDELNLGYSIGGVWKETITSGIKLQTNTWYHVAVSFNATGNQVTYYLNGVDILKATMPSPPAATNTSSLKIGRSSTGEYWKGLLDDVRIYDSVLSEKEISELFTVYPGGFDDTALRPDTANDAITLPAAADTYIFEAATTANYGSQPEFLVGTDSGGKQMLGLIRFDTASIPAGATVTSATLRLYATASAASVSTGIYKIRNSWNENTATWNNMSSGGNYDSMQLALTTPAVGWTEWVLPTGLIHEWIDGVSTNYGIALEYTGSSKSRQVRFASKEQATSTWRPQLVIEYTAP